MKLRPNQLVVLTIGSAIITFTPEIEWMLVAVISNDKLIIQSELVPFVKFMIDVTVVKQWFYLIDSEENAVPLELLDEIILKMLTRDMQEESAIQIAESK